MIDTDEIQISAKGMKSNQVHQSAISDTGSADTPIPTLEAKATDGADQSLPLLPADTQLRPSGAQYLPQSDTSTANYWAHPGPTSHAQVLATHNPHISGSFAYPADFDPYSTHSFYQDPSMYLQHQNSASGLHNTAGPYIGPQYIDTGQSMYVQAPQHTPAVSRHHGHPNPAVQTISAPTTLNRLQAVEVPSSRWGSNQLGLPIPPTPDNVSYSTILALEHELGAEKRKNFILTTQPKGNSLSDMAFCSNMIEVNAQLHDRIRAYEKAMRPLQQTNYDYMITVLEIVREWVAEVAKGSIAVETLDSRIVHLITNYSQIPKLHLDKVRDFIHRTIS